MSENLVDTADKMRAFLVGESRVMVELRAIVSSVARSPLPVLIQGPTGAGKELVATEIHRASARPGDFVAFNVCAVSETMFEDALFGHVRGAFTGALHDTPGYLLEANRGTVLFDEIAALPLSTQSKLLRVLETHEFRPIGARSDRRSDFRIVSSTNEDVMALAAEKRFRPDLAYRLSGVVIEVPALRRRLEDVPALVQHFLAGPALTDCSHEISDAALEYLMDHDWPGNVRELRRIVERASLYAGGSVLTREVVVRALRGSGAPTVVDDFERRRLTEVLRTSGWDTRRAAAALAMHRATLYRQMRRLDITVPAGARSALRTITIDDAAPATRSTPEAVRVPDRSETTLRA